MEQKKPGRTAVLFCFREAQSCFSRKHTLCFSLFWKHMLCFFLFWKHSRVVLLAEAHAVFFSFWKAQPVLLAEKHCFSEKKIPPKPRKNQVKTEKKPNKTRKHVQKKTEISRVHPVRDKWRWLGAPLGTLPSPRK